MPQLMERNLSGLLNETFLVYGNHLKEFLLLAFVVQLPLSIINWAAGDGVAGYVVSTILAIFIGALAYGAGIYAVGQQYVTNRVDIVRCYRRVQWRLVSLMAISLITAVTIALGAVLIIIIVPFILALVYVVYWSVAQQAAIIEGHKHIAALNRSLELVRGQWWRVFGVISALLLVAVGLSLLVYLPFLITMGVMGSETGTTADSLLRFFGGLVAGTAATPVLAIGWTLLYYDLRLRKEDYDLTMLSQELGLTPVAEPS